MATEDEHRLYTLLAMARFDTEATRGQLNELLPDRQTDLKHALENYRDGRNLGVAWRQAAEDLLDLFAGVSPTADVALGRLVELGADDAGAEDIGHRWREDVLDTAWRIVVADRMANTTLPE